MSDADDKTKPGYPRKRTSLWHRTYRSLQFKASLLVILLMLVVVSGGTALSLRAMGKAMFGSELHRTREWAVSLASSAARAMEADDRSALLHSINTLIQTRAVAYVAFADPTGEIIASAESRPGLLKLALPPDGRELNIETLERPRLVQHEEHGLTCIDVVAPVFAAPAPGKGNPPRAIIGYLRLAMDVSQTRAKLARFGNRLLRIDVGLLLLVIPCTLLATRHIVSPLNELAEASRALANGTMEARVSIEADNEIGDVARSFNVMANRVAQSQMELLQLAAELETRVEQRTRELEELASKDSLTGLHNRRHFSEVMRREFAAAERYHSDLTCLMFDLDLFKQVNDRFGHGTGDEVLIILARSILSQLRSSDVAARFGGDEFILLLPQTSASAATTLADRIVERFSAEVERQFPDVRATVSVGVASIEQTRPPSAEALTNQADLALYAAKASGRNCTMQAPHVVTEPKFIVPSEA